jgi:hypothetical protein
MTYRRPLGATPYVVSVEDLDSSLRFVMQQSDRFWAKVQKSDGCWEWTAAHLPQGYGEFMMKLPSEVRARPHRAHRVAWMLANKRLIPAGLYVCHHCDNPKCVRPEHLFLGTHADNTRDMVKKGRHFLGKERSGSQEKSHCKRGHAFTGENCMPLKGGGRRCLQCFRDGNRIRARARRAALKASAV